MKAVLYDNGFSTDSSATDSVQITLHNKISPFESVTTYSGILKSNGEVKFRIDDNYIGEEYYISITHRNSIETWSNNPVLINKINSYDFTR